MAGEQETGKKPAENGGQGAGDDKVRAVQLSDDEVVNRSCKYSKIEGALGNADLSIRNSYTTPYALALNATNAEIGLLTSLQNLASTVAQLPGAKLPGWVGGRKSVWFLSNVLQKIFWVPIIILPFIVTGNQVLILIILLMLASFFGGLRGPAWSSLMGEIVPKGRWGKFFGQRNIYMNLAGLMATIVCGQMLIWAGFSVIFALAFALGIMSIFFFAKIFEPRFRSDYHYSHAISLNFSGMLNSIKLNRNFTYFTLFMTAMNFAVYVASPFFAVYMLHNLNLGYGWYTAFIVIETAVIIISQGYWGELCDRIGDRKVTVITGLLICFVPFYWMFITNPYEIIIAEILTGFAWSGFGVATFNFMLAASPADKRAEFSANYAFLTGIGLVAGALVGGLLADSLESTTLLWMSGLQLIFLISFLLRLSSLAVLPLLKEARVKEDGESVSQIFWLVVAVNPMRRIRHVMLAPTKITRIYWKAEIRGFFRWLRNRIRFKLIARRKI